MSTTRGVLISLVAAAVLSLSACGSGDNPSAPPATSASPASAPPTVRVVGPLTPADAQALATMNERVKEYVLRAFRVALGSLVDFTERGARIAP